MRIIENTLNKIIEYNKQGIDITKHLDILLLLIQKTNVEQTLQKTRTNKFINLLIDTLIAQKLKNIAPLKSTEKTNYAKALILKQLDLKEEEMPWKQQYIEKIITPKQERIIQEYNRRLYEK